MKTPRPKHTATVCSVCGLDWKAHGQKPTIEKCVELLAAEVRHLRARAQVQWRGTGVTGTVFPSPQYGPQIGRAS